MNRVFFLVLRQMRVPLLLLSVVYAVATIGLTLIPGTNDTGDSRYLDFFHAFYFVFPPDPKFILDLSAVGKFSGSKPAFSIEGFK